MRILACSDVHGDLDAVARVLAEAGQADVLVVAGDLGNQGQGAEAVLQALRRAPCDVVLVAGNHDNPSLLRQFCHGWSQGHFLHGTGVTLRGIPFFGLGGEVPRAHPALWNFGLSEAQARAALAGCPKGAVLVTHSPPKGHCDRQEDGSHEGADAVLALLQQSPQRLHLCGHIHANFGQASVVQGCGIHNLGPHPTWFEV